MRSTYSLAFALCLAACSSSSTPPVVDAAAELGVDAAMDVTTTDTPVTPDVPKAPDVPVVLAPVRATAPFARYANPLVGSGGAGFGVGSTFPGPQRAFGLARPGPDTTDATGGAPGFSHCAGYAYSDGYIAGFSQMHMHGTGIVDYGALGLMPAVGMTAAKTRQAGYLLPFHHANETVEAGYYRVAFDGSSAITTEITATDRVALYRVTFPAGSDANLLFDLGHVLPNVTITAGELAVDTTAGELHGRVHFSGGYSGGQGGVDAYFVARLSRPLAGTGTWSDGVLAPTASTQTGTAIGAYVPIDTHTDPTVTVAIGLSYTDVDHARANLAAEAADLDFDRVHRESTAAWESLLSRVQVEARGDDALRTLYSAVYHTLLMPSLVSDADGTYRGVDKMVHHAEAYRYYSDLSLWDTFRTEHPWLTLVYPEYQRDFVRSIIAMADVLGFFPRWPLATGETGGMLGDSGAIMMADTWLRGLRDFDAEHAWGIARQSAFAAPTRREGLDDYMTLHYLPADGGQGSSASKTMEYAYADAALSNLARGLGHADDADTLLARSHNYRNLYDPAQRFVVGRNRDGSFLPMPHPNFWNDVFAEGDAWQYLWYAPHDLDGLSTLLGGRDAFLARLDEMFTLTMNAPPTPGLPDPYYWQGNEPDIHAPWMPSAFDDFPAASRYVDWVRNNRYGAGPGGIPGNDDAGTMSAWYMFAALGVFPVAGTEDWLLAAPAVTDATVTLAGGATLHVSAPNAGTGVMTARSITWGGTALAHPRMTQAQVGAGGTLVFDLGQ